MFSESPRRLKTSNRSRARKEDLPAKDDKGCPLPDCHRRSVNSTPTEHKEDLSSRVFEPNLKSFVQEARAEPLVKGNAWGFGVRRAAAISDCAREGSRGLCESRWRRE
jgi:hypothetical protein